MITFPKLRTLTAVAAGCAAMAAVAPANAFVYAASHIQVDDFRLSVTGATTSDQIFSFNLSNTANMFGSSSPNQTASCNNSERLS